MSAAQNLVPFTAELGGKGPLIVFEDCDLDAAAKKAAGQYDDSGQVCLAGTRLLVQESVRDAFLEKFNAYVDAHVLGDPRDDATTISPLIHPAHLERVEGFVERARAEGTRIVRGGARAGGLHYEPTLIEPISNDAEIVQKEVFGPVLTLQTLPRRGRAPSPSPTRPQYGLSRDRLHGLDGPRRPRRPPDPGGHRVGQHVPRARPHGAVRRRRASAAWAARAATTRSTSTPSSRRCRSSKARCDDRRGDPRRGRGGARVDGGSARAPHRGADSAWLRGTRAGGDGGGVRGLRPRAAVGVARRGGAAQLPKAPRRSAGTCRHEAQRRRGLGAPRRRWALADPQRPRRRRPAGRRAALDVAAVRAPPRRRLALRPRRRRHEGRPGRDDRRGPGAQERGPSAERRRAAAVRRRGGVHRPRRADVPARRRDRRRLRDPRAAPRPHHGRAGRRALVPRRDRGHPRARRLRERGLQRDRRVAHGDRRAARAGGALQRRAARAVRRPRAPDQPQPGRDQRRRLAVDRARDLHAVLPDRDVPRPGPGGHQTRGGSGARRRSNSPASATTGSPARAPP